MAGWNPSGFDQDGWQPDGWHTDGGEALIGSAAVSVAVESQAAAALVAGANVDLAFAAQSGSASAVGAHVASAVSLQASAEVLGDDVFDGAASIGVGVDAQASAAILGYANVGGASAVTMSLQAAAESTGNLAWNAPGDPSGWQPPGWHFESSEPASFFATASVSVEVNCDALLVDAAGPFQASVVIEAAVQAKGIRVGADKDVEIIDARLWVERKVDRTPQYRFGSGFRTRDFYQRKR